MISDSHQTSNSVLTEKIEAFIKKFYLNRLIQGALIGAVMLIVFFLIINGIEFISWFSSKGRLILFLLMILVAAFVVTYYFIVPLVNLIRFRKKMSDSQAAILIGKFFPQIQDKLLNTLQLSKDIDEEKNNDLLIATVEQRTQNLQPIRFSDAVNLKDNYKYLKFFGLAFVILTILVLFVPNLTRKPVERIINYNQVFEKPLPYQVILASTEIEAIQGSDVEFKIQIIGERIPESFYIKGNSGTRLMNRLATNEFRYIFKNVFQSENFSIQGGDYISPEIHLIVRPTPTLLFYETNLRFPKYIKRKDETLTGKTRIIVPQGTQIDFVFHTRDVDSMLVVIDSVSYIPTLKDKDYIFSYNALISKKLNVYISNQWDVNSDPIPFTIDVIPDAYPEIQVQPFHEDFTTQTYYSGLIADDYGFTKLKYHFNIENKPEQSFIKEITIDKKDLRTSFYYSIDLDTIAVYSGDEIKAFFEIWDNDGINGPKARRSETFFLSLPTKETLDSLAESSENKIINQLNEKSSELEQLRKDIEEMLRDLMSKKELDWTDKEKMKALLDKQKEVEEEWNKVQEEQKELSDFLKKNELTNEDLIKKQEQINKLFDEVIPDEMKKLMEEIEKLMSEMPREEMQKMLQELKKDNKQLQEMMDRNLALLEQLKVEKEMNSLIDKLNELAEQLEQMNEQNNDSLSGEQAQEQFDKIQKQLDSLMKQNQQLPEPFDISQDQELTEDIERDLQEASESEAKDDNSNSSKKKNDAGKKMKKMADGLQMQMQGAEMEQLAEDAHLVRILLENVVRSSHSEEELLQQLGQLKKDDPSIPQKISKQKEIVDNFVMVEDSLRKMALRQPEIKNFVFTELQLIDQQLNMAMKDMLESSYSMASSRQQQAMMSMNNLALMLAESLNNMDDAMGSSGSCSKPNSKKSGKGKQSMKNMKDLQQQLGEQLKKMQQQMQQQKNGQPNSNMSEELARMAAQQELIREGMQQILDEMKENGILGDDGINQIIKDMEKLEEEIVNKRITNQTMQRNKDILSRMLKAENAQQEREKEEKRKSEEFKGIIEKRQIDDLDYQEKMKKQQDFLRMNTIEFQPFYKEKINDYFFRKNNQVEDSL